MCQAAEVSPSGTTLMASCTSPWPGRVLRGNTSASSVVLGEEASGGDSLAIAFESSEHPDEDRRELSRAGLQLHNSTC